MTPGERKRFEARYSRWAAAFYITFALAMAAALAMMLTGCAESHPLPDHAAPDLGECVGLAASDGGVAHVYAYPNGHPCEGGTCQQGVCEGGST